MMYSVGRVALPDGGFIGYRRMGKGPSVVLIHDAFQSSRHMLPLAESLSDRFSLWIPDRRGRGMSSPATAAHDMRHEAADMAAVVARSRARAVVGTGVGASIAAEMGACGIALESLVLHEPRCVDEAAFSRWMPRLIEAVDSAQWAVALRVYLRAVGDIDRAESRPVWGGLLASRMVTGHARAAEQIDATFQQYAQAAVRELAMARSATWGEAFALPDTRVLVFSHSCQEIGRMSRAASALVANHLGPIAPKSASQHDGQVALTSVRAPA